jgi:hypothetical protein
MGVERKPVAGMQASIEIERPVEAVYDIKGVLERA